jgi:Xaa-Pro aminopeptidase
LKVWDIAVAAQKFGASIMNPGVRPGDVFKQVNDFLAAKGQPPEGRLNAHGQGYDLVERPTFTAEEDMLLQANMVIAMHPTAATAAAYAMCCDDFLITERGAERMHTTAQRVFVIGC